MVSATSWHALEQRISIAVKLPRHPVAVGFLNAGRSGVSEMPPLPTATLGSLAAQF
jgi:hypothetical protein